MGLLDQLDLEDPKTQLLIQMGFGLLGGAPGSRKNFAADLGHAGMMGLGAFNNATVQKSQLKNRGDEMRMRQEDRDMRYQQIQSQQAEQQRKQEKYAKLAEKYPQYAELFDLAPEKGLSRAFPEQKMQFAPNGQAVDMNQVQPGQNFAKTPDWKDPEYVATQKAIRAAGAPNVTTNVMPPREIFKDSLALKKDFDGLPEVKGFKEVQGAWDQISTALKSPSPANDLAAATKFMKLLDPGSVVRESELMMAMQASGALDRMANMGDRVLKGHKLTPEQRKDFYSAGEQLYKAAGDRFGQSVKQYEDIAGQYGLDKQFIPKQSERPQNLKPNLTAIYKAREAIKKGADPEAVKKRLMEQGYDPKGL